MRLLARLDLPPVWLVLFMGVAWFMAEVWAPLGDWGLWPGRLLIAAGLALAVWAAIRFRAARTPLMPGAEPAGLVTDGPYRFSRNPIYVADMAILAGWALVQGTLAGLLLLIPFALVLESRFIRPEEARLAAAFGADYDRYRSAVRRWL